jgi:hypothetical protein
MLNIAIIGKVSSGKSSFINSLVGYPISTVSLQRETFVPIKYIFERTKGEVNNNELIERYKSDLKKNEHLRENNELPELCIREIKINYYFSEELDNIASITDYPGLDDSNDKRDLLEFLISNLSAYHLVIFVTQAESVFVAKSEVEIWNKLRDQVELQYAKGSLCKLICLVSKYESDNEDLLKIYEKNCLRSSFSFSQNENENEMKSFRWNAFNSLLQKVTSTAQSFPKIEKELIEIFGNEWKKIKRYGSLDETFDFDGLCKYLSTFNVSELKSICEHDYYVNILDFEEAVELVSSDMGHYLYNKSDSCGFIEELWNYSKKNLLKDKIQKYLKSKSYFDYNIKYLIFFKQTGFIENIHYNLIIHLEVDCIWWEDDIFVNEVKKFIEEDESAYVICPKYNNEEFYIQNPLFNDFYRNWIYREFKKLIYDFKYDIEVLLQFTPSEFIITNKFVVGLFETYCKKNKAVILESSKTDNDAVKIMRLCPTVFKYPTIYTLNPEKIEVDDMIEYIRENNIKEIEIKGCYNPVKYNIRNCETRLNLTQKSKCKICYNEDIICYEIIDGWIQHCYCADRKIIEINYELDYVISHKYTPQEEAKIINYLQIIKPIYIGKYRKLFPNSWAYVDLNLFPECKWITTDLNIKGWKFIQIFNSFLIKPEYDNDIYKSRVLNSPMEKLKDLRIIIYDRLNKKKFAYTEEFLDYCYEHQSEIIPQHIILNNCTF